LISSTASTPLLQACDIAVRRGAESLFTGLNFEIGSGQLVWLRGANGSGKTSLLRTIAGLAQPYAGRLLWPSPALDTDDDDVSQAPKLVYLGHNNGLKDDLTALEALQFLLSLHGRDSSLVAAERALSCFGMRHRRHIPVRALSQGQRKRVALARLALEEAPLLWVLDEPLDALDDAGIATVHGLLQQQLARGGAVLMTSHIPLLLPGVEAQVITLNPAVRT
jgi:heme exporter protein A